MTTLWLTSPICTSPARQDIRLVWGPGGLCNRRGSCFRRSRCIRCERSRPTLNCLWNATCRHDQRRLNTTQATYAIRAQWVACMLQAQQLSRRPGAIGGHALRRPASVNVRPARCGRLVRCCPCPLSLRRATGPLFSKLPCYSRSAAACAPSKRDERERETAQARDCGLEHLERGCALPDHGHARR